MPTTIQQPRLYFTVTNDLTYDQRMIRICTSLASAGYIVCLVGRSKKGSVPLSALPYNQKRLFCFFEKGPLFYAEFNIRLFFYLLFQKSDGICAIDLDTIIPCYLNSRLKNVKRFYDAHELFCEMKEIRQRPFIYNTWKLIERLTVPYFKDGYTVNEFIAAEYFKLYGCSYEVIRSIAKYYPAKIIQKEKYILYQGAVNEGRSFETLIPAMKEIKVPLYICGDGNFMEATRQLVAKYQVSDKVHFMGMLTPEKLAVFTQKAYIGITLFEKDALSNYYSLANRFFDYLHAGTPQLCVDYPVYRKLNNLHHVAVLTDNLSADNLARQINQLLNDAQTWQTIHINCLKAAQVLNWQNEEKVLIRFYNNRFG